MFIYKKKNKKLEEFVNLLKRILDLIANRETGKIKQSRKATCTLCDEG